MPVGPTLADGNQESGGKKADTFPLISPSPDAQFFQKVRQETCCICLIVK